MQKIYFSKICSSNFMQNVNSVFVLRYIYQYQIFQNVGKCALLKHIWCRVTNVLFYAVLFSFNFYAEIYNIWRSLDNVVSPNIWNQEVPGSQLALDYFWVFCQMT